MTSKEAIIHGEEQLKIFGGEHREFIEKSIEALKREPCEDCVSLAGVFEIMGDLISIPYDLDRRITEKDVSESMDRIRELPRVKPKVEKEPKTEILDKIRVEIEEHSYPVRYDCNSIEKGMTLTGINQVIDKYKAESEG